MMKRPLLLVEDDIDDHEMIMFAFEALGIKIPVLHFPDSTSALEYLRSHRPIPFLIISDVNMPTMNGLEFKQKIESSDELKGRNIPFVFLSTSASDLHVRTAFALNAQGFFVKGSSFADLRDTLKTILDYWAKTRHPN